MPPKSKLARANKAIKAARQIQMIPDQYFDSRQALVCDFLCALRTRGPGGRPYLFVSNDAEFAEELRDLVGRGFPTLKCHYYLDTGILNIINGTREFLEADIYIYASDIMMQELQAERYKMVYAHFTSICSPSSITCADLLSYCGAEATAYKIHIEGLPTQIPTDKEALQTLAQTDFGRAALNALGIPVIQIKDYINIDTIIAALDNKNHYREDFLMARIEGLTAAQELRAAADSYKAAQS